MSKLLIPVGIPGCGKSTLARTVLADDWLAVHSSDAIREELTGDITDQTRNDEVFETFHARITNDLTIGIDVFADATNLRDFAREKLRVIADRTGASTHLLVFTNVEHAVGWNHARTERIVPDPIMVRMIAQYEQALRDIPTERYTTVTHIERLSA